MKYVLLGTLDAKWAGKQAQRTKAARAQADKLGIKVQSVLYTQGQFDFVDLVDAPSADAMLAFSVWYARQGFGKMQSLPAFDEKAMTAALRKSG